MKTRKSSLRRFGVFLLPATILLFFTSIALRSEAANPTQNVASPSAWPNISTDLKMVGPAFEANIGFHLDRGESIQEVKSLFQDPALMRKLSSWVQNASFTPKDANGNYGFALTLGKYGHNYLIQYGCAEQVDANSWKQVCGQLDAKSMIMKKGRESIGCHMTGHQDGAFGQGMDCEMDISGEAGPIGNWLLKFSGSRVAYTYFTEMTSYVSKIALLAGRDAKSGDDANSVMIKSDLLKMMMAKLNALTNSAAILKAGQSLRASAQSPDINDSRSVAAVSKWPPISPQIDN